MEHVEVFRMGSAGTSILVETSTPTRPPTRSGDYTLDREEPLIVYGQELPSGAFGLPLDRMPRSVGEVIRPDKGEWTSAKDHAYRNELAKYPVLLTPELYGHEEVAYVGSVEDIGHPAPEADYQCTIRRDERIPAVQGSLLEPFAEAWGMPKYGKYFRHTEWRLVDADLYKLLVTELHPSSIAPKMFNLPQRSPKNQVALMMPFAAEFNPVREAVDKAAKLAGVKCIRGSSRTRV
ncbi:hypothetical protein FAM23852_002164 [Propionibacterium freudenreichii]|uniref:hypothetical protein n=1 Tax=Propionibacterium freudenreichii TaxID=1744 RepID=UPI00254F0225|nr:hypothetical protein [Propionibacterium freudenreichii]MDK9322638.1 hypothetical protein [Propionibacterium freudenreichii]